mmetsp:Transcript_29333/g.90694  ORF Transcript_29333/g.90694 Transcript_29333/m.90694 type:complete len:236 (+) Transcript_29333:289-996(+)
MLVRGVGRVRVALVVHGVVLLAAVVAVVAVVAAAVRMPVVVPVPAVVAADAVRVRAEHALEHEVREQAEDAEQHHELAVDRRRVARGERADAPHRLGNEHARDEPEAQRRRERAQDLDAREAVRVRGRRPALRDAERRERHREGRRVREHVRGVAEHGERARYDGEARLYDHEAKREGHAGRELLLVRERPADDARDDCHVAFFCAAYTAGLRGARLLSVRRRSRVRLRPVNALG